jgi:cytochrome P450
MCILLLVAGHETTVNLISNGMLALLRNPDQLARLRADPGLIRTAVEELLRYESPVQLTGRIPMEDVEIGGTTFRKGQEVVGLIGAANRDPAQFPDPDRLDVGRPDNRHLAFGAGIHFCLGAPLARLEGAVAIAALVGRAPNIELASDDLQWRETVTLRGLSRLPVTFG